MYSLLHKNLKEVNTSDSLNAPTYSAEMKIS